MSKKDKEKKKKLEPAEARSAWMADLRKSRPAPRSIPPAALTAVPPSAPAVAPVAADASSGSARPAPSPQGDAADSEGPPTLSNIPRLRPVSLNVVSQDTEAIAADSDDLEEDDAFLYSASVGPTEFGRGAMTSVPPASHNSTPPTSAATTSVEELESKIRDLEARLNALLRDGLPLRAANVEPAAESENSASPNPGVAPEPQAAETGISCEASRRHDGPTSTALRALPEDVSSELRWQSLIGLVPLLRTTQLRFDVRGVQHVPVTGRALLVCRQAAGRLPHQALLLRAGLKRAHTKGRELLWLWDEEVAFLPLMATITRQLGAARAHGATAERLLEDGHLVCVFVDRPGTEGVHLRAVAEENVVRLCLRTGAPIVPCSIHTPPHLDPQPSSWKRPERAPRGWPQSWIEGAYALRRLSAPSTVRIDFDEPLTFRGVPREPDPARIAELWERVDARLGALNRSIFQAASWAGE